MQKITLEEVVSKAEAMENPETAYFSVTVDKPCFDPPKGCREIGLLLKMNKDDIDEDLLDVMIMFGIAGIGVMLEVPAESDCPPAEYLMAVSTNVGFAISLLPPEEDTDEAWGGYIDRVTSFTRLFVTSKNFSNMVYPVSSYIEYLYLNALEAADGFKPKDPYIIAKFASKVSKDREDEMKAKIGEAVFGEFGSKEAFEEYAIAVAFAVRDETESTLRDMSRVYFENVAEQEGREEMEQKPQES